MKKQFRFLIAVFMLVLCTLSFAQRTKTAADYFSAGNIFQDKKDWYSATGQYLESVKLNPAYAQAWFALAECSYALGEWDLTLGYLESVQKYAGGTAAVLNLKGFTLIGLNRLPEARTAFNTVLTQFPNDTQSRFGLAQLDLFDGKISGAETYYLDALKRQPENRQALLSLALVSQTLGKNALAKQYSTQALRFHASSPEVYYFAAYISAQEGLWREAETRVRAAIQLEPSYDAAYELLATVLFAQGQWQEVIDVCDFRIARNRNVQSAWYVKAVALQRLNLPNEAIIAFQTGLEINPEDEIMRAAAELLVRDLPIEDPRRPIWARFHSARARDAAQKFQFEQAKYEYRNALLLEPQNTQVRLDYAEIFLHEGYPETYVSHLEFVQSMGDKSLVVSDKIEAYNSLLQGSLAKRWNVDPFYLNKSRWNFGLYCISGAVQMLHPGADMVTAHMLSDVLSSNGTIAASAYSVPVNGFAEAFRLARQNKQDYFGIVSFEENDRELTIQCTLYVGRTGSQAAQWRVYRTGNGRYADALRRIQQSVFAAMPVRGTIIARNGYTALADVGKVDGVAAERAFTIVKNGHISTADKGIALLYDEANVFGTFTVTATAEEIAQGQIKPAGYFDRVNIGDELIFTATEQKTPAQVPVVDTQKPALLDLIRSIY